MGEMMVDLALCFLLAAVLTVFLASLDKWLDRDRAPGSRFLDLVGSDPDESLSLDEYEDGDWEDDHLDFCLCGRFVLLFPGSTVSENHSGRGLELLHSRDHCSPKAESIP